MDKTLIRYITFSVSKYITICLFFCFCLTKTHRFGYKRIETSSDSPIQTDLKRFPKSRIESDFSSNCCVSSNNPHTGSLSLNIAKPVSAYRVLREPRMTVAGEPETKKRSPMKRMPILVGITMVSD